MTTQSDGTEELISFEHEGGSLFVSEQQLAPAPADPAAPVDPAAPQVAPPPPDPTAQPPAFAPPDPAAQPAAFAAPAVAAPPPGMAPPAPAAPPPGMAPPVPAVQPPAFPPPTATPAPPTAPVAAPAPIAPPPPQAPVAEAPPVAEPVPPAPAAPPVPDTPDVAAAPPAPPEEASNVVPMPTSQVMDLMPLIADLPPGNVELPPAIPPVPPKPRTFEEAVADLNDSFSSIMSSLNGELQEQKEAMTRVRDFSDHLGGIDDRFQTHDQEIEMLREYYGRLVSAYGVVAQMETKLKRYRIIAFAGVGGAALGILAAVVGLAL